MRSTFTLDALAVETILETSDRRQECIYVDLADASRRSKDKPYDQTV